MMGTYDAWVAREEERLPVGGGPWRRRPSQWGWGLVAVILLLGLLELYATRYDFGSYRGVPERTNRYTGQSEVLLAQRGWVSLPEKPQ